MHRLAKCGLALAIGAATTTALAHDPAAERDPATFVEDMQSLFAPGSIVDGPKLVDCKLSGGTQTTCISVTFGAAPTGYEPGPWCPRNIEDGPEESGIWLNDDKVYAADGPFIANLSTFYDDPEWQLFDPATGAVRVTETRAACQAAARPDVDPAYFNYCVECRMSFIDPDTTLTYIIPVRPVDAEQPGRLGRTGAGLAFSGVRLEQPAPVEDILAAHTLAPFDKCGGHVNPHVGYHVHAVTDCLKQVPAAGGHAPMLGIAMDGYAIHALDNAAGEAPHGLDACRGHDGDGLGYHYHVSQPGTNQILGCLKAEIGCVFINGERRCDATRPPPPPR